jgi:cytoskeletal protein CcmA (bactofilin family)
MKFKIKDFRFKICLLFVLLLLLLEPSIVFAQGQNEFLRTGQVIDSDYFKAGQTIQINGDVHGDTFLAGGMVTVNGKVDGDLFIVGGKVIVNGEVGNSVRIVGGDVTLNGPVGRNALIVCGNCSISKVALVMGSLLVAGGNLEVNTPIIGRGFRFFGRRLYLNSSVSNEAYVVADREFILGPQSSISGNLKYTGSQAVVRESGASVGGTIAFEKSSKNEQYPKFFGARTILSSYEKIRPLTDFFGFAITAVIGFILLGLFAKGFEKGVSAIENQPYASLGWGIVTIVMVPVVAVLFALTLVGIPLSIVLVVVGYVVFLAAKYLMAFFIGRRILLPRFGERRGWALVLGLFLFFLLSGIVRSLY